jgi:heavy metal translocating P-type ATPase
MRLERAQKAIKLLLVAIPSAGLTAGVVALWVDRSDWAALLWTSATLPVLAALLAEIVLSLRNGDFGLDIVAALSMAAALVFGEHLAASVVALMYAGGQYLESFAEKRASREMTALLARVPRTAIRHENGGLEEVALEIIEPNDRLLIRRGDVVPVDGIVANGVAVLDESALTGESLPVRRKADGAVMSGSTNVGDAFDLTATRRAAESTYAGIVRLVEQAQHTKAPMARLADRYAIGFLGLTLGIATGAWLTTGDPIRAVAVLVVATPCPLILAVPVALVSGLSLAAKHGILIKGGKALEVMARVRSMVIDKTGTLTEGRPQLLSAAAARGFTPDEILRIAASLDQASKHTVAETIVTEARRRGVELSVPTQVTEAAGEGMTGEVDGKYVVLGGRRFVAQQLGLPAKSPKFTPTVPGSITIAVGIEGHYAGELILADTLRAGTEAFIAGLRSTGVKRIILATGDRQDIATAVATNLPFDAIRSELTPDQKVLVVIAERKYGPVMMIGDGVNDAPALAAADLGVAMGARGTAASAEAADVVLLVDQVDRVLSGIRIAKRARRIALESVYAGIGLSFAGMIAAAFGVITPVQGAILQEIIDITVILNALRALKDMPSYDVPLAGLLTR